MDARIRWCAVAALCAACLVTPAAAAWGQPHQHPTAETKGSLFESRDASGTAWLPSETPMTAVAFDAGSWELMLHGSVFVQGLYESGDRHRTGGFSAGQVSSANWAMVMARRRVAAGRVGVRLMASAEPWTVRDCGFINLLASGEMCEGDTIHDRQHPHDLMMEVAADYDRPLGDSLRWQLYGGLSGEPALGPAGFPHRPSAMPNPIAPITHHWLDSTHIAFGVISTGLYTDRWKAEISVFNGREPDEQRADLDLGPLDSVSGRLSVAAGPRLSLQVSTGYLREAEAEFPPTPRSDIIRATASATYHRIDRDRRIWATTLAYGMNHADEIVPEATVSLTTHAVLLESSVTFDERHTWFGRLEAVGKPGHDLHVHEAPVRIFPVGKAEAGYTRHFRSWKGLVPGFGGVVTLNVVPEDLAPRYSGRVAFGLGAFFTLRPGRH